ncbi:unnamed protein product [Sphenostylis stenocarpa]|uniref:Uncharacterized protein n=1 Tax=Sphenostylis stenocarpa TaxID=92480 RepID=A0AA86S926_9FABA|nr:unnamed protein product [Sphenostylis stenocarpa]
MSLIPLAHCRRKGFLPLCESTSVILRLSVSSSPEKRKLLVHEVRVGTEDGGFDFGAPKTCSSEEAAPTKTGRRFTVLWSRLRMGHETYLDNR